jgi:hypothetical protein
MECSTLNYFSEDGVAVYKPKVQYDTLDEAIKVAKIENAKSHHIHKLVAYKCNSCFKYHIGRNGKEISEKKRLKLQKELKWKDKKTERIPFEKAIQNVKIVGYIDLTNIK